MVEALGQRRLEILRFLARRASEGPPSVREIGDAVGLKSTKSTHANLRWLQAEGYVERVHGRARSVRLTERGWEAAGTAPLLGRIAAGRGVEAVSDEQPYSLTTELLSARSGRRRFVLEARGESMTGAGIEEGDLLVIEENPSPPNGSVVAAMIVDREEGTVKTLYREGDTVRLRPRNGDHEDIVVLAENVTVHGTVEWVVHRVRGRGHGNA